MNDQSGVVIVIVDVALSRPQGLRRRLFVQVQANDAVEAIQLAAQMAALHPSSSCRSARASSAWWCDRPPDLSSTGFDGELQATEDDAWRHHGSTRTSSVSARCGWRSTRARTRRRGQGRCHGSAAEIDGGSRPGTTTTEAERLRELEREVKELRRANAILRSASAFFAAGLDRPSH